MGSAKPDKYRKPPAKKSVVATSKPAEEKHTVLPEKYVKWLVFIFAFLLYADTLDLKYTLDDSLMITENSFTKKGVSGIKEIFTNDAFVGFLGKNNLLPGGRYRPLSQVMFALEKELFGFNPFVGHLLNVLFYALACMLLFVILQKLFKNYTANRWYLSLAFVATILFAAHPLHTEVVANIKGRDEILCLLFSLLTLYCSMKYIEKPRSYLVLITCATFFLGILSKENALTFIAVIPLVLYMFTKAKPNDYVIVLVPLVVAVLLYFILRVSMIGTRISHGAGIELLNDPFIGASLMQRYATILLTWLKYLSLLVFPHPLTHDYYPKQIPIIGFGDYRALLSLLIFGALLVFSLLKLRKKSMLAFAILFFFVTFSIVSNLVFDIGTFMNERFMFTALLGFTIFIAWLITEVMRKKIKNPSAYRSLAVTILIVVLLAYSAKTVSRNRVWMDDLTLFTTDVKVSANSSKCNTSAGGKLLEKADSTKNDVQKRAYVNQAVKYLNKAVEIYPRNLNAWLLLGNGNIKLEQFAASRECYVNCLKINPKYTFAINNLLHVAQASGLKEQFGESKKCYLLLNSYKPNQAENYYGLGLAYRGLNQFDSALISFNKALELKPKYGDAMSKMGEVFGQNLQMTDKAEECFMKALQINPKDESALENLGIVYGMKHDYKNSLYYFQKALEVKPDRYAIYQNISLTYRSMGDLKSAQSFLMLGEKYKPTK